MPDANYKDFGAIGRHPAFQLGYEHPELVDALADLGHSLSEEHPDMEQQRRHAGAMLTYDADIPTRIFSLARKENLLDALVTAALELEVELYLMATHRDSGERQTVWQSRGDPEQNERRPLSTLDEFQDTGSALVLDILSRPTCERLRILVD